MYGRLPALGTSDSEPLVSLKLLEVQKPTVVVLNAALGGCILSLLSCFCLGWSAGSPLTIHFGFLLVLASLLMVTINWYAFVTFTLLMGIRYRTYIMVARHAW